MTSAPMYGPRWPRWWVKRRGWLRIAHGFCPYCYSSPPRPTCPICNGSAYGNDRGLNPNLVAVWAARWYRWCNP